MTMTLPMTLMLLVTAVFLLLERMAPGRALPESHGWYLRALSINAVQLISTLLAGQVWPRMFGGVSVFALAGLGRPALEGLVAWFVGTFVFYWWHRLRHRQGFWVVFHQVHHSPSRIEVVTSFYKHPVEIATNTLASAVVLYGLLGCSLPGTVWYNLFAATGEYFYHANVRTPPWLRYIVQTPELHSIHHQTNLHWFNFGDIPLWDRLFGTYRDALEFAPSCGFTAGTERHLGQMLLFREVSED